MGSDIPSRRETDTKFDAIIDRLDTLEVGQENIAATQIAHMENEHVVTAAEAVELIAEHNSMVPNVALSLDLLAGKPILDMVTGIPTGQREPGIADRVKSLEWNSNGGRGFSVRNRDKIIIAGLTTMGLVLAEVIRFLLV